MSRSNRKPAPRTQKVPEHFVFRSAKRHIVVPIATIAAVATLLTALVTVLKPSSAPSAGNSAENNNGATVQISGTNVTVNLDDAGRLLDSAPVDSKKPDKNGDGEPRQAVLPPASDTSKPLAIDDKLVGQLLGRILDDPEIESVEVREVATLTKTFTADGLLNESEERTLEIKIGRIDESALSSKEQRALDVIQAIALLQGPGVVADLAAAHAQLGKAQALPNVIGKDVLVWGSDSLTLVLSGSGPLADLPFIDALQQRWPLDEIPSADEVLDSLLAPQ